MEMPSDDSWRISFWRPDDILANAGRATVELRVVNTGDRPVQVGSHFHFFEVNRALRFDREKAFGMRLNIPAGTAVAFRTRRRQDRDPGTAWAAAPWCTALTA